MNKKEFNEKWSNYLVEGHYGLDISNEEVVDFLDKIFEDLTKIDGFKYYQIKQKYYSYRFYTDAISITMENLVLDKISEIMEKTNG